MTIHALQFTGEMQCGRQVTSQNKQKKSGDPILHLTFKGFVPSLL